MSAKRHKHTFHLLYVHEGVEREENKHWHPCWDEDCTRILWGPGWHCDGKKETHWRETQ